MIIPMPKQQELIDSKKKITIYRAGNRSGKTYGLLLSCLKDAKENKTRSWYVAFDLYALENKVIPHFEEIMEDKFEKKDIPGGVRITLENESIIDFKSSEASPQTFSGIMINNVYIDEIVYKSVIEECMMRIVDLNGRIKIAWTPYKKNTLLLELEERPDCHLIRASTFENPFLNTTS